MNRQRLTLVPLLLCCGTLAAEVKRVVVIKVDGVPQEVLERELQRIDPSTRRSSLPWIDRVFAQNGTRVANFYVRSISLSTPSWSMLDTGHHLQIRGNAEFDRYTYQVYDYLNFFPFYVGYARSQKVDMPGVEVLDSLGIPLLSDRFPYRSSYQSFQLFQRGVHWKTLQRGLQHRFSKSLRDLLDEWTLGFEIGSSIEEQAERELIEKLSDPQIQYLDYFTGEYDHVAHSTPDAVSQRSALQRIDALVGRVWTAIESTPDAARTMLVLISDHGMNTQPGVYSQGYDLVAFFNSLAGGAHHVVTNRHPLTEYKLKGLDPFVSEVVTASEESLYLKGQGSDYPTVLLDLDGNERADVYLRNSDLNALHILLGELNRTGLDPAARRLDLAEFFRIVDRHRAGWQSTLRELREELGALRRAMEAQRGKITAQPKKWTAAQRDAGLDKESRRLTVQMEAWRNQERRYTEYADKLEKLLALRPADFEKRRWPADELIPARAMGDANTVCDLQNYVVGPAAGGHFQTISYFPVLAGLAVRNNVQAKVGAHPVDFIAMRIPNPEDAQGEDTIWLYASEERQALIFSRHEADGGLELRYQPVRGLRQESGGAVTFEPTELTAGFPLRLWEDTALDVPEGDRARWLTEWHGEQEWFRTVHKTAYSNGILALHEQFWRDLEPRAVEGDARLLERFNARRRRLAEPDFLVFANNHWNFNVRGFNPGGNHGSLLRMSSHSVLMLAGGDQTGIPRDLVIEEPYDSLSFVPTILELLDRREDAERLPGKPIRELAIKAEKPGTP
ncbi:MAG TPA: alkaline phosphatase family protein [Bryobacteraceae bacterium]|nr:alkaline phosphatase family protein [Bryobacteraceae bacterium]